MEVVAHLPPALLSHLRIVLGHEHRLVSAADWGSLDGIVRRTPVDVAVLDPNADGVARITEVVDLARRYPSLPIVLYTVLAPPTLKAVVELSKHGVHQVVLHRFDDEPRRFLETLEQQPDLALGDQLLERLAVPLALLPIVLGRAIERMYRRPGRYAVAGDLAASAGMPRRTMYRLVEAAGLASPSMLVRGARLLRAYTYLRDAGHSTEDVAFKTGYSSRQLFARHVNELFGVRPTELRRCVGPEEFVRRLSGALYVDTQR